jgi:DNA invertase Pin-like site-specific DNA recombinase
MKTALYARVSTDDKDQNPETQLLFLREYCDLYGHEIVEIFVDEGKSGKDPNRPEFQRMMTEAISKRKRRFDAVICLRLDRFMRSALYGLKATEALKEADCGLIFVKEQIDTTTPGGRFFYTLMLAFAQMEREHHGERVSEGIHRRLKEGGSWGKGRRKDVNVGLAVELLRSGKARSISDAAKQLGIPASTLTDHARRKGIDLTDYTPSENGVSL